MLAATRALLVLLLAALAVLSGTASAQVTTEQQRIDELGLTVAAGYGGRSSDGAWQPVTVGIEPARPVEGSLSVGTRANAVSETLPVEVAAGSRKVFRVLVPPGPVQVTFSENGAEPLTVRPADVASGNEFLVGLLGTAPDSLPPVRSDITGQSGAWVVVEPAWLELSAKSLDAVGTLVASVSELQDLSPSARANLAAAVAAGTDLIVAGGEGADLAPLGLPGRVPRDPWRVRDESGAVLATVVPAGYGRVVTTAVEPGDVGAGRSGEFWSLLAQPIAAESARAMEASVTSQPHQFNRLLAESEGEVPALPGLGAFVVAYVLVVGPVNGFVLAKMGRRELAWATVPLVTLIFTVGAFLGATTARPPAGGAARLTYWVDGSGTEFVAAGVRAPTPGNRTLELDGSNWTVRPLIDGQRTASVTRAENTAVRMDLTALQLGGVAAWRPVEAPPPLNVTATATPDGVRVKIRNVSGRPLTDVVVRAALSSRSAGSLAAGETTTIRVGAGTLSPGSAYRDPFEGLPMDNNGSVSPPASMRAVLNSDVADGRPGMVWVSAVDDAAAAPVARTDGEAVRDRGAMVAVGAPIASGRGGLSPFVIGRDATEGNGLTPIGPEAFEGSGDVFLRYRLPAGASAGDLTDRLDVSNETGGNPDITVWDRAQRRWVDPGEILGTPRAADAVSPTGEVWARASGEMFPFEFAARTVAGESP